MALEHRIVLIIEQSHETEDIVVVVEEVIGACGDVIMVVLSLHVGPVPIQFPNGLQYISE